MNNLIFGVISILAIVLCYAAHQLIRLRNEMEEVKILLASHHAYSSVSIQHILIMVKALMTMWMQEAVAHEEYQIASEWRDAINRVDKLIQTKIK